MQVCERQANLVSRCQPRGRQALPVTNYRPCVEPSTPSCFGVFGPVAASSGCSGSSNGTTVPSGFTNTTLISLIPSAFGGGTNGVATIFGCKYGAAVLAISSRRVFDDFGSRMMRSMYSSGISPVLAAAARASAVARLTDPFFLPAPGLAPPRLLIWLPLTENRMFDSFPIQAAA